MTTTQPAPAARRFLARDLSRRVAALRAELSETEKSADRPGKAVMVRALKRDLLTLESRCADAMVAS